MPARYASATYCIAASVTLSARTARRQRMPRARGDQVGAPDDHPGLRAAEQLVARERHERGAVGDRLADAGLVVQPRGPAPAATAWSRRARPDPASTITGGPSDASSAMLARLGEADHPVVRRVHLEHERSLGPELRLVVGPTGAVGGADLDEPAAATPP